MPEHTLASKALAYGMGADFLEQDVILSRDRIPIVLHDVELDAVTNVKDVFPSRSRDDGKFYVIDFDLVELKQLRVNERINRNGRARYPDRYPAHKSNFKISSLVEEIELIQGLNNSTGKNVGLYTEVKSPAWHKAQGYDISPIVLNTLSQYGYKQRSDNIFIQCFDPNELRRIRHELNSDLKLVQLIDSSSSNEADTDYNIMRTADGLKDVSTYADGIGPSISQIIVANDNISITSLVSDAHKLGLAVHPYTLRKDALPSYVSEFDELMALLFRRANVDGVFTDFPDLAIQYREGADNKK